MSDPIKDDLAEGLANCAREPVQAPGAIQPAGCLVSMDSDRQRVLQVSANIREILGMTPAEAFELSPARLLGSGFLEEVKMRLESGERLPMVLECRIPESATESNLQATVYQSDLRWVFEFEPVLAPSGQRPLALLNRWIKELGSAHNGDELLSRLVEAAESLTGYDRIMVYQFDEQWHGTVVSERLHDGVESFLGHRFPATDIPP